MINPVTRGQHMSGSSLPLKRTIKYSKWYCCLDV